MFNRNPSFSNSFPTLRSPMSGDLVTHDFLSIAVTGSKPNQLPNNQARFRRRRVNLDLNMPPPPTPAEENPGDDLTLSLQYSGPLPVDHKMKGIAIAEMENGSQSKRSESPVTSSMTTLSSLKRKAIWEEVVETGSNGSDDATSDWLALPCPKCWILILIARCNPKCPRCGVTVPWKRPDYLDNWNKFKKGKNILM